MDTSSFGVSSYDLFVTKMSPIDERYGPVEEYMKHMTPSERFSDAAHFVCLTA
jgi:hypothetical protein